MAGPMDHRASVSDCRAALQKWRPEAIPANWRHTVQQGGEAGYLATQRAWYQTLSDAGLATAHWPGA